MWYVTGVVFFVAVFLVCAGLTNNTFLSPTTGDKINPDVRDKTALLIVDMQSDYISKERGYSWPDEYIEKHIETVNLLVVQAKRKGWIIVSLRQEHRAWFISTLTRLLDNGRGIIGSEGGKLDSRLDLGSYVDIAKPLSDAFSAEYLSDYLEEKSVGKLVIAGLDGVYCVTNTAKGAISRGYTVEIFDQAVLTQSTEKWVKEKVVLERKGVKFL